MTKEYKKLDKSATYDKAVVEELVEAMTEVRQLQARERLLQELIDDNQELHQFIWGTADGKLLAHHQITDDHLKNILTHVVRNGRPVPKALKAEARKRGIEVPAEMSVFDIFERHFLEGEVIDD